jgi:hypothetical protein
MGVAEIMHVGAGGIEERSIQGIDALAAADDSRRFTAGEFSQRAQRDLDRPGAAARQRHGEKIHQGAFGLMPHGRRNVIPPRLDDKEGKALGHAGPVQHHYPPRIWREHWLACARAQQRARQTGQEILRHAGATENRVRIEASQSVSVYTPAR